MGPYVRRRVQAMWLVRRAILAPALIGLVVYYLTSRFSLAYKPLLILCGVIVGWPVKISLGIRYEGWRRAHRARELSAATASESRGKLFCDIDVLWELRRMDKDGFVGELICFLRRPRIAPLN